ncbi:PREDICTED: ninjurin-2-like [Branchiostoma belcheri]|uniref:Ninjurin-2-like n=1 Tax=Branchiostoma belcheri TaxID=7741 RepID=A0A6P4ZAA2_BRABE|nr:PREDICTED: ninjurin-2-like [Branchiostoma belcheri]KAI8491025.1 hypothetical protein Bbelb_310660 [Branchiostoma belcheri]
MPTKYDERSNELSKMESNGSSSSPSRGECRCMIKEPSRYDGRKTIAQSMLDLALLTSNVAQLKYLLQHPDDQFYVVLLSFLGVSIGIQLIVAAILGYLYTQNIEAVEEHNSTKSSRALHFLNNAVTVLIVLITVLNVIISGFDMKLTEHHKGGEKP